WTTPRDWNERSAGRLVRTPDVRVTQAPEPELGVEVELAFLSKYVWRGQLLTDDPVLQPAATINYGDWSFTAWGNLELTDVNDDELAFTEVDLVLEYARTLATNPCARVFAGVAWYAFPTSSLDATAELYAGMGLNVPLQPRVTLYYDVAEVDGIYVQLSTGHSMDVAGGTLALGAHLGWGDNSWNRFSWGVPGGGPNDLLLTATWTYASGPWSIKPSVAWSVLIDDDIRDAVADSDEWILGLTLGYTP
ncbi:MAG: hypothetical protein QNJ90_01200, partial [Planctomycetota bacterium]|nr:hypothetical protein [Planctomycetota bacterium]